MMEQAELKRLLAAVLMVLALVYMARATEEPRPSHAVPLFPKTELRTGLQGLGYIPLPPMPTEEQKVVARLNYQFRDGFLKCKEKVTFPEYVEWRFWFDAAGNLTSRDYVMGEIVKRRK